MAIDGKSLRRGYQKGCSRMPPLMVSVWDSQTRVTLAQARVPGGNGIAATLKLLGNLVLKECTVTADALHCHPAIAQAILDAKADYALGLKANHGPLYAEATGIFAAAGADAPSFATKEMAHGRFERRRVNLLPAPTAARALLPGLKALGRVEATRIANGKVVADTRYVALSRQLAPIKLAEVLRCHWGNQ